jgi:hypothetical protein
MTPVMAQQDSDFVKNTQQDIMLVGAAGLGGAILGLSTLSFYETPSRHISNLWTGASIGIIAGVIFVAYNSAQKGSEELIGLHSSEEFSTQERHSWHQGSAPILTNQSVQFGTHFFVKSF